MKKLLTIVILFTLVLAGCGQNQSEKNSEKHNEEKTVDTTEERNDMINVEELTQRNLVSMNQE
ncbi:hypothetical protein [Staphylococcus aureus]|uniref:hypothetical protein n=1 Tax=Staphylococcus aureus TaxID=1280 RepID=UPI0006B6955D|nr:hypothetical protein [Staphylococcus aureus]CUD39937.1 Putative Transfer complex protein TraH [Staphylococcus aureus]CUE61005.1 Putative Transfer complex protein TraH [Staphylococcus aureus]